MRWAEVGGSEGVEQGLTDLTWLWNKGESRSSRYFKGTPPNGRPPKG
jgi:hypothetical protein